MVVYRKLCFLCMYVGVNAGGSLSLAYFLLYTYLHEQHTFHSAAKL